MLATIDEYLLHSSAQMQCVGVSMKLRLMYATRKFMTINDFQAIYGKGAHLASIHEASLVVAHVGDRG